MKEIKINTKYKLYYAFCLFAIYIIFLSIYSIVKKNNADLFGQVFVWGIPILFIYYTFIYRMKILITNTNQLICKSSNDLFSQTIDLQKIHKVVSRKKCFFTEVIIYYDKNRVKLYPQNSLEFLKLLKSICENAKFNIE